MTNEQLAEFIQEGDSDLKPVLWERVKKLLYMFSRRYYSRYADYCERCGVTEWDLKQQAYSAFELSLQGYSSERGAFSTYLTFGFKRSIRELFKSKDPLVPEKSSPKKFWKAAALLLILSPIREQPNHLKN